MLQSIKYSKIFQKYFRIYKELSSNFRIRLGFKNKKSDKDSITESKSFFIGNDVVILTTQHCYFVASLIKKQLLIFNIQAEIIFNVPQTGFKQLIHFVICPQTFKILPQNYIAFQMEQTVSSKWFTEKNIEILQNALCIFDYSLNNLTFLQKNKIHFRDIYYLPIYYNNLIASNKDDENDVYDLVFYGDVNNERRKKYIEAISSKFKIKVLDDCFGDELYEQLNKAKIILNIHSIEEAYLETTRIYECLSLNKLIISEKSTDFDHHVNLHNIVEFTEIGDIDEMIDKITYWLNNDNERIEKNKTNKIKLNEDQDIFSFYFNRFLLANNIINFDSFKNKTSHPKLETNFLCLSLPETVDRRNSFIAENKSNIKIFNGLRNAIGWIGCGYSFQYILYLAQLYDLDYVIVCEDDVEFLPDFEEKLTKILSYLTLHKDKWDIYSGFITDVHKEMDVSNIEIFQNLEFIYIDRLMSMVFNIYNKSYFNRLEKWDASNLNKETNTIDKFIDKGGELRVITNVPYLVGHKDELTSSIWKDVKNTIYNSQTDKSVKILKYKIQYYKNVKKINSIFNR